MSASSTATAAVGDFEDGSAINQTLLVRDAEVRRTRSGAELRLALPDRTGVVPGIVWENVNEACQTARPGAPLRGTGTHLDR